MSRIYFHSIYGDAEVSGRERAHFGGICSDLLASAIGPIFDHEGNPSWTRKLVPPGHYLHSEKDRYERSFGTMLRVGHGDIFDTGADPFTLSLNTALAVGGDPLRLAARIHGQCEIHCWVDGENRDWLAGIIEQGRLSNLFRKDSGWEQVIALLREENAGPVVLSYSVCDQFPNQHVAEMGDDFYELTDDRKWEIALAKLKARNEGLELTPKNWEWPDFYFSPKITGFDLFDMVHGGKQ